MPKTMLLILISICYVQCSSSDENTPIDTDNGPASFSLFVDGEFFVPASSGKLYISDANGALLVDGELLNNQQTTLETMIDPNGIYDATIFLKLFTNGAHYNLLYTYENISPGDYTLQALQGYNPNNDEITFNLTNTGEPVELISSTRPLSLAYDPANGGTNILNGRLAASPGNYYASVKKSGEPFPRYIWSEGLTGDTNITSDYNILPFVEGVSTVQFPNNELVYIGISGVKSDDPIGIDGVRHLIQEKDYTISTSSHAAVFPVGIFDAIETTVHFKQSNTDNAFEFFQKSTSVPSLIPEPSMNFDISNSSFANFSATTAGEYDFFNTAFVYANAAQDVSVIYEIYGMPSAQITLSKTNLFNNLFADDPNINADVLTSAKLFGITNYSQITSYTQFLGASWLYGPNVSLDGFMERVLLNLN